MGESFLPGSPSIPVDKPNMEAAGIEPANDSHRSNGWIYLISDGGWSYKIGFARDPEKRLRLLQTGSPEELRLVGVIDGPPTLERELHELFASHRIRGEWFSRDREIRGFFEDHGWVCVCPDTDCFLHGEGLPAWSAS